MHGVLMQSCSAMKAAGRRCTIEHDLARIECVAREQFGNQMVIGYYSGTLRYTNFHRDKNLREGTRKA